MPHDIGVCDICEKKKKLKDGVICTKCDKELDAMIADTYKLILGSLLAITLYPLVKVCA